MNTAGEVRSGERLLQEVDSLFEDSVVGEDILRIAGDEEHWEVGVGAGEGFGELAPVHFGHDDIGDENIGFEVVVFGEVDGLFGGGEGSDFEAKFLESHDSEFAYHVIVLDENDFSGAFGAHIC